MLSFEPPPEADSFATPGGTLLVWFPVPGIVAARARGFIDGSMAKATYARIDREPQVPYVGFLDLSGSSGFDWDARMCAFRWNVKNLSPQMDLHLLITDRFVMATRVLAHLLGNRVEFHHEPGGFASAYTLAVKRKSRVTDSTAPGKMPSAR